MGSPARFETEGEIRGEREDEYELGLKPMFEPVAPVKLVVTSQLWHPSTVVRVGVRVELPGDGEMEVVQGDLFPDTDHLADCVRDLRRLHDTMEGRAELHHGGDEPSFVRFSAYGKRDETVKVRCQFYRYMTFIAEHEVGLDEPDFFDRIWAVTAGVQGLMITRSALACLVQQLGALASGGPSDT